MQCKCSDQPARPRNSSRPFSCWPYILQYLLSSDSVSVQRRSRSDYAKTLIPFSWTEHHIFVEIEENPDSQFYTLLPRKLLKKNILFFNIGDELYLNQDKVFFATDNKTSIVKHVKYLP